MNLHPKVSEALNKIVDLFHSGNVPQAISIATYPSFDVPSNAWSLSNRIIMAIHGTSDARGYNQWAEVDRYVKKGSKAFHILAPWLSKRSHHEQEEDEKPIHISVCLRGFIAIPVFKVEDTDGDQLEYQNLELPNLPLLDVAKSWGIDIAPVAFQGDWFGCYRPGALEQIRIATPSEKTFFHELSHAAHKRIKGELKNGQDWKQEVVAELSAQTLCYLVGTDPQVTIGNSFDYIRFYAAKANKDAGAACVSVLSDVEKVLTLILEDSSVPQPAYVEVQ